MKAIILEVRDGWAAALREDGTVVRTRRTGQVGETIELNEKVVDFPARRKRFWRTAVAAVLVLAITGGTYTYTNVAEASYVTLDTEEESIEFSINRMGRVIGVRALDDSSAELARELLLDVRRMRVEDAMDVAMTRMNGAPTVVFGVTGETERGTAALYEAVERGAERREHGGMEFFLFEISHDERREARGCDMSGGRMAFEHHGGAWGGKLGDFKDRDDDWDGSDLDEPRGFDDDFEPDDRDDFDDIYDRDDENERPAFGPEGGVPMPPPGGMNGGAPVPPPWGPRGDAPDDDREDVDDREDGREADPDDGEDTDEPDDDPDDERDDRDGAPDAPGEPDGERPPEPPVGGPPPDGGQPPAPPQSDSDHI